VPHPAGPVQRTTRSRWTALVLLLVVALGPVACSSTPEFDRARAVDDVLAQSAGRLTRPQAECYVDRVVAELGTGALAPEQQNAPDQVPRLTRIRVDCTGVASLGTTVPVAPTTGDATLGTQPQRPGDDPHLDQLYDACKAGSGAACDQLFDEAPLGSVYEQFAGTCGDRTRELRCADRYPGPTASSTTVPR
jgi:hypothetical protein